MRDGRALKDMLPDDTSRIIAGIVKHMARVMDAKVAPLVLSGGSSWNS